MIQITVSNINQWVAFLKTVPPGAKRIAIKAFSFFMLPFLREYPAYKYVTRKSAYGMTWFSEKQRRWFWANGGPSMIGNNRTFAIQKAWRIEEGNTYHIVNDAPGVGYVMGHAQANQPRLVGWRTAWDIVRSNMAEGIAAAQAAVNAWLGSK